ncbi:uncharacterized protein LOC114735508 [Neltuma alba]|uniref:uncharacterized protein LOC114735508 n=1 Tax=Neltuma alba TaxID=207710 RepID=UPI0010A30C9C|nr:uncharacterized protein LOC114735508 [Prosopis alba]
MDREEGKSDRCDTGGEEGSETNSGSVFSDFKNSEEEEIDDDYFSEYVDVGVNDVLEEVVESSEFWRAEPDGRGQNNVVEAREEDILGLLSDHESEGIDESARSSEEDDEGEGNVNRVRYNPVEMCKEFKFVLGMEFTSIGQFKDAVREYALLHGYEIKFVKNDKVRCRVKCAHVECKWLMFVSQVRGELTYRLTTLHSKHTCGVSLKGKNASYKWIAEKIVHIMKRNKNIKLADIIASVREHYMVDVSVWKAYMARKKAKALIDGDYKEQYHKLRDYCNEVRKCNLGTTFALLTDQPCVNHPPVFKRLYECIGAVKRGFVAGCRPIIGLDGCFLKGPYGGILLVAVGRDANDQYFPLAWAVVESESRDSWTWFLKNLFDDIGSMQERRWVFISDQQKGLVPTFEELLEGAEHRFCVRHLYSNIKVKYGGGTLIRDLVLRAAKATVQSDWRDRMNELKAICSGAHDHLMAIPPSCWSRSHFDAYSKCDTITNNITESFNGRLLEARELPIISLLDWIRTYLMTRFAENRVKADKYRDKGIVCPRPRKRLDKEVAECRKWEARYAGNNRYEVSFNTHKFKVDLTAKTCSCYWWQLNGIPCRHAAACIYAKREDPHDYVDKYLTLQSFVACYSPVIEPINGEALWEKADGEPIEPPVYHKRPGRPTKKRKKGLDEQQSAETEHEKRQYRTFLCSNCGKQGHNRRTCKQPTRPNKLSIKRKQSSSTQESIVATPPGSSQP